MFRIRRLLKPGLLLEEVSYIKQIQLSPRLLLACVAGVRNGKGISGAGSPWRGLAPKFPSSSLSNVCHAPRLDSSSDQNSRGLWVQDCRFSDSAVG